MDNYQNVSFQITLPFWKLKLIIQIFTEIIGFPTTSNDSQAELAELEARRRATFDRILSGSEVDIIKPGVLSLLDFLDEREIPAVISTTSNRERVDRMFAAQTEIRQDNFVVIVSSDQDPEYLLTRSKNGIIKLAIQNLSCTLDQPVSSLDCMMFEDSPSGVTAARHVDVGLVVAIPDEYTKRSALTGHDFKFNQAHLVAQDFNYLQYIWTSV